MQFLNQSFKNFGSTIQNLRYRAYTLSNFRQIPQIQSLPEEQKFAIEVVGHILPFKTNNYVVDELIDWEDIPNDPIFLLTFPQRNILYPHHFEEMAKVLKNGSSEERINEIANKIRRELNTDPAGQIKHNIPSLEGEELIGMQHKYKETVLFFPSEGQTCHAYCTFCFRWPQFVGIDEFKFAMRETKRLIRYLHKHPEITDILITGGDPLVMKAKTLAKYIRALLEADLPNLQTIRMGTKSLSYWPYRFLTDPDAGELLNLFREVQRAGKYLAFMAHFNHPRELETKAVQDAIMRVRETGAQIRTQSPLLAHINDRSEIWVKMWKEQVRLGCIPYYMFIPRDTSAQHYFSIPLVQAWQIFRKAYQNISGISRTVRGPSMSAKPGKVQILGVNEINGEKVFVLRMLQGRNPDWALRPFFAKYNEKAIWLDELEPAFGAKKFFFEEE